MKIRAMFSAALFAAILPAAVQAQASPFSAELRGGAGVPTGDFADGAKTGWGLGANVQFRFMPALGAYASYSYNRFGTERSEFDDLDFPGSASMDVNIVDSGFGAGLIAYIPGAPMLEPWVRGGVILNQLSVNMSGGGGSESFSFDRGLGFELGGGLAIPVAPRVSLTPGLIYRSHKPKFDGETSDEALTDVSIDIGLRIRF